MNKNTKKMGVVFLGLFIFMMAGVTAASSFPCEKYTFDVSDNFSTYITNNQDINISGGRLFLVSNITRNNRYLWIANSGEGSVSKVDTKTDKEVARYWTGSHSGIGGWSGEYPSRTAVDIKQNVWVGNRAGDRTVIKIASNISDCEDRNGDNIIETSFDANSDGAINHSEMLSWGDDECVVLVVNFSDYLNATRVASHPTPVYTGVRAVAIDPSGFVWVGLYHEYRYIKIDPESGEILADVSVSPQAPYGAVIDKNGMLWGAPGMLLAQINTNTNTLVGIHSLIANIYGIGIDSNGAVWGGQWGGSATTEASFLEINASNLSQQIVHRVGPIGNGSFTNGTTGVTVASNGHIWGTSHRRGMVYEYVPGTASYLSETGHVGCAVDVGGTAHGITEGFDGYIWAVNTAGYVSKINPDTCALVKNINVGPAPYTYSDATGSMFSQIIDSGSLELELPAPWVNFSVGISWDESNMLGGNITFKLERGDSIIETAEEGVFDMGEDFNGANTVKITITVKKNTDYEESSPVLENLVVEMYCNNVSVDETNCVNGLSEDCDDLIDAEEFSCISNGEGCSEITEHSGCNNGSGHPQFLCGWECAGPFCPPSPVNTGNCLACNNINNTCSGYNNKVSCEIDPCQKALLYDCPVLGCDINEPYSCVWDVDNRCKLNGTFDGGNNCIYYGDVIRECDGINEDGLINFTSSGAGCSDKQKEVLCPHDPVKLNFFTIFNLISAIGLIVLFYHIKSFVEK